MESGSVIEVTEDHSLLDENGNEVRPKRVNIGDVLMTKEFPKLTNEQLELLRDDVMVEYGERWYSSLKNAYKYIVNSNGSIYGKDTIKSIREIYGYNDYVYDLETENHHFAAGIGNLIVHNTDSSMIDMHMTDPTTYVQIGEALASELSSLFPQELVLECEKVMKVIFICAKRYVYYIYDKKGNIICDKNGVPVLSTKGTVTARRDYAPSARETYERLIRMTLGDESFLASLKYLIVELKKLLRGDIDYHDLIIVKGMGANYAKPHASMKLFGDRLAAIGKPIKSGERIGYLMMKGRTPWELKYTGNRMFLPEEYEESKFTATPLEIDYIYYAEKQYCKNIDMLLKAAYREVLPKYNMIKVRRTSQCKYIGIEDPIKFMIQLLLAKKGDPDSLDLLLDSIDAIDRGEPEKCILTERYEASRMGNFLPPTIYQQPANPIQVVNGLAILEQMFKLPKLETPFVPVTSASTSEPKHFD